jgi:hypothetical protein
MGDLCFQKCVAAYKEPDLNIGEMSCIDRCVGKYLEAQKKVGEKINEINVQVRSTSVTWRPLLHWCHANHVAAV